MTKRTKITLLAVIVSIIIAVAAFASVRNNYPDRRYPGGEGLFLALPAITYFVCRNITDSMDLFSKPVEEDIENYEEQIITKPKKVNSHEPHLVLLVNNKDSVAEDTTT